MSKTTDELNASKAGSTAEQNGMGSQERPFRPGGLYRLKDEEGNVVDEQIVKSHPLFGDSQAAAFERVGYKYVRPAEKGEVKELEITPNAGLSGNGAEDLKGLQARMSAFEDQTKAKDDEIASLKARLAQIDSDDASKQDGNNAQVVAQTAADTKAEAVARTEARQDDSVAGKPAETQKTETLKTEGAQGDGNTVTPANSNAKKESK